MQRTFEFRLMDVNERIQFLVEGLFAKLLEVEKKVESVCFEFSLWVWGRGVDERGYEPLGEGFFENEFEFVKKSG